MVIVGVLFMVWGFVMLGYGWVKISVFVFIVGSVFLLEKVCVKGILNKRLVGGFMDLEILDIVWC